MELNSKYVPRDYRLVTARLDYCFGDTGYPVWCIIHCVWRDGCESQIYREYGELFALAGKLVSTYLTKKWKICWKLLPWDGVSDSYPLQPDKVNKPIEEFLDTLSRDDDAKDNKFVE